MQKKYQQLRSEGNKRAAEMLFTELKKQKAISQQTFDDIYAEANNIGFRHGSFCTLYTTTQRFLFDHDLMTKELINGLIVYVATQKCFRSKTFENATKETQPVMEYDIDEAIKYVELNDNKIPLEYEGPVVAKILNLSGKHKRLFIQWYKEWDPNRVYMIDSKLPIKFKVLNPVTYLERERLIEKV